MCERHEEVDKNTETERERSRQMRAAVRPLGGITLC